MSYQAGVRPGRQAQNAATVALFLAIMTRRGVPKRLLRVLIAAPLRRWGRKIGDAVRDEVFPVPSPIEPNLRRLRPTIILDLRRGGPSLTRIQQRRASEREQKVRALAKHERSIAEREDFAIQFVVATRRR